jgi:ribosomal protein L37AE/L43A
MSDGRYECPRCGTCDQQNREQLEPGGLWQCRLCGNALQWDPGNGSGIQTQEEHRQSERARRHRLAARKRKP